MTSDDQDQTRLDSIDAADQANLDGYAQGFDDGYTQAWAVHEDLLDQLRVILWRHQQLAARDRSIQPAQVLHLYQHTLADLRRVIDP